MRNLAITVISLLLTSIVIGNAYYQKKQFYPSVVYITKSNPSMAIIYIQAFIVVIIVGKLMRRIFFGELRAVEIEHLMERSWYAITETCLAFTVFRDDFNPKFLALFTLLLFLKAFHWLADERVDYMERSPVISWLFHIRIVTLLIILGILDVVFVYHAYQSTLNKGASVQLVFGFEYAILSTIVINIVIKYVFHVNDYHELPWENKAVFLLYTELIMGFVKVILYFSFVIIMVRIYTLPLFAFRPMYYTIRAFKKAVNDVVMSRRAIRNMNTLYPDATPEELTAMDNVCIICREEMRSAAKKLPCNHIFHTSCLRSWFQRQQTCPTCRLNILRTPSTAPTAPANAAPAAAAGGAPVAGQAGVPPPPGTGAVGQQSAAQPQPAAAQPQPADAGADIAASPQPAVQPPHQPSPFSDLNMQAVNRVAVGTANDTQTLINNVTNGSGDGLLPSILRDLPTPSAIHTSSVGSGTNEATTTRNILSEAIPPMGFLFSPWPQFSQESIHSIPPFPFSAFNVAPPMPPPEGLSDDELRRLEQNTREGLEQRIRYLYSIQTMLDTAVLMMHQYSSAVAAATAGPNNYSTFTVRDTYVTREPSQQTSDRPSCSSSGVDANMAAGSGSTFNETHQIGDSWAIPTSPTSLSAIVLSAENTLVNPSNDLPLTSRDLFVPREPAQITEKHANSSSEAQLSETPESDNVNQPSASDNTSETTQPRQSDQRAYNVGDTFIIRPAPGRDILSTTAPAGRQIEETSELNLTWCPPLRANSLSFSVPDSDNHPDSAVASSSDQRAYNLGDTYVIESAPRRQDLLSSTAPENSQTESGNQFSLTWSSPLAASTPRFASDDDVVADTHARPSTSSDDAASACYDPERSEQEMLRQRRLEKFSKQD